MDQGEKQRIQEAVKRRSKALDAVREQQLREHMALTPSERGAIALKLCSQFFDRTTPERRDDVIWRKWQRLRQAWRIKNQ